MNSRLRLTAILIICLSLQALGQKVKYKDLYVLLSAKQYAESEVYLKRYLKDNDDNPNAYLFMGIIYQDKASRVDMLKDTKTMITMLDSAVFFYDKTSKMMTEKELSKHEEYYEMYMRRDLRTGKFGVNISDVKLDLETRLKLKDRAITILTLKARFLAAENYYKKAQVAFQKIQKSYANQKEFYLRADDSLMVNLSALAQLYDSCHMSFNDYKATSEALGKTGYNQDLDPVEITNFKTDGNSVADFYRDDLKVWDYKRWALGSRETIEKEIRPILDQLVVVDTEINNAHKKLETDSVSVMAEVGVIEKKMDFQALKKIDPSPMPIELFKMKLATLSYASQIVEDKKIKDSLSIALHIQAVKKELQLVKAVDSLAGLLTNKELDEDMRNYTHFVTTAYRTPAVVRSLIKTTKDMAASRVIRKENELKKWNESLRWIVNGADSIPLFTEVAPASRFKPLILTDKFTVGLQYADSIAHGYFYLIDPTRKANIKAVFDVDKNAFKKRYLPSVKALSVQDEKGLVYFFVIFSEANTSQKIPATIVKIYKTEGLAWSVNYTFDARPELLIFSPELFDLSVKTKSSIGEISTLIFDKNGKIKK